MTREQTAIMIVKMLLLVPAILMGMASIWLMFEMGINKAIVPFAIMMLYLGVVKIKTKS